MMPDKSLPDELLECVALLRERTQVPRADRFCDGHDDKILDAQLAVMDSLAKRECWDDILTHSRGTYLHIMTEAAIRSWCATIREAAKRPTVSKALTATEQVGSSKYERILFLRVPGSFGRRGARPTDGVISWITDDGVRVSITVLVIIAITLCIVGWLATAPLIGAGFAAATAAVGWVLLVISWVARVRDHAAHRPPKETATQVDARAK